MHGGWRVAVLALAFLLTVPLLAGGETLGEVYRRVNPAVVVIRSKGQEVTLEGTSRFREIGSGVLISPDGKVATAAHVVHTMEDITVEFIGEEPIPARVIASEPRADISIIQASVVPRDAVVAKLTDSDPVRVGDPVFIVGAPYGLAHSMSVGWISARWPANTVYKSMPLADFFQTTATINQGNSGGPMFSMAGQVVEVARIGFERIHSATPLGRHHIEEQRSQLPLRGCDGFHLGQCCCLTKRSGGTVTTISRGLGSTKVASANIAAYPIPAMTATTASNLIKVGMAAYPRGPLGTHLNEIYS